MARQKKSDDIIETETVMHEEEQHAPVQPKIMWRGSKEWRHDLFKLKLSMFKQNHSWKKYEPNIKEVEHVHFFHSTDKAGRPQDRSSVVGDHYHVVKTKVLPDGTITAECGPPLRTVSYRQKNGKLVSKVESIQFYEGDDSAENTVTDTHTHQVEYMGSEMLSEAGAKHQAAKDKAQLEKLEAGRTAQGAQV